MISTRARISATSPLGGVVSVTRRHLDLLFWPLGFALVLFALSTHSPIGEWSEENLSVHMMVQHGLNLIPGLILGRLAASLVAGWQPSAVRATNIFGVVLTTAVLGLWHLPVTFEAAMHHTGIHVLMHSSIFLLAGIPLGLSLSNLGGSGRLLLLVASVPFSILGTIIPYSAPDLYPSYAPWQHVQMAWLMMVAMPPLGLAVLVLSAYWRALARLWCRYHLYEYGTASMALLLLGMLIAELAGLGHFHMLG